MKLNFLPLVGALAMSSPAFAITVNMTDFSFAGPATVETTDTSSNFSFTGQAGRFDGKLTEAPAVTALRNLRSDTTASFTAYCAELTQNFAFNVDYTYDRVAGSDYFGAARAANLSRLFTAAQMGNFVVDNASSAAMQAAIWEIIYETGNSYSLLGGTFLAAPSDASYLTAFTTVDGFLTHLGSYSSTGYRISALTNAVTQDFLVAAPVPEPGTWALLAAGLGVLGLVARRRRNAA